MLIAGITVAQDEARVMESEGKLSTAKDQFKLLIGLPLNEEIDLKADMEFEALLSIYGRRSTGIAATAWRSRKTILTSSCRRSK